MPIPSICVGVTCSEAVLPEYEFRSSRPDIGGFVKLNTASGNPLSVLLNASGEPVKDGSEEHGEQVGATSGLFCPYNKGETDVTISAGGLSYTLPITVQAGSVREPCGTVPLRELPPSSAHVSVPPPAPAPQPSPTASPPVAVAPIAPPPPPVGAPVVSKPSLLPPFVPLVQPVAPLLAFVPPPLPTPARPTPPSGTSAVTSPVEAPQREEENEEATESVSNQAVAYAQHEHEPASLYLAGLLVIAALAAVTVRSRPRRGRREIHVAPATTNATRAQSRWSDRPRGPW